VSYRMTHGLDADIDLNRQPHASPFPSDRAGGNLLSGTFGIRQVSLSITHKLSTEQETHLDVS
jgi:hypothetical protein